MKSTMLKLTHIEVIEYRMPLKRPYGTARGTTRASGNFLVVVSATDGEFELQGVGECQPRHNLTGDGDKSRNAAWRFLCAAAAGLQGLEIDVGSRESAIKAVKDFMAGLAPLAVALALPRHREKPFRGTLLGIEVAMLDLVSRAMGIEVSELLGKERDRVAISISTISSAGGLETIEKRVAIQKRFPMTRVKGVGDIEYDLGLMREVARVNGNLGRDKPIWIDINEAHDQEAAENFISAVARLMASSEIPNRICIEGMLPKSEGYKLASLQRYADSEVAETGVESLDLRVMPDEGLWDVDDLERLNELGGCRAINIKAPKAGGLLASLDLARAAVKANPDVHICIGGMVGTSDITTWALYNLAKALPRLDYITAVPPGNVEKRISVPLAAYAEKGGNVLVEQKEPGIGTSLDRDALAPYTLRVAHFRSVFVV